MAAIERRDRQSPDSNQTSKIDHVWSISFEQFVGDKKNNILLKQLRRPPEPVDMATVDVVSMERKQEKLLAAVSSRTGWTRNEVLAMDMYNFLILIDALSEDEKKDD
jgi:hypothetical protein